MILLPLLCAAYLLGSIPTGVLVGRLKGVDVRRQGSGNVGATNVARVVGKLPGLFVLLVDVAKGWAPVAVLSRFALPGQDPAMVRILLGVAAVAGHIWNPFLQFNGGKGVATALGVLFALDVRIGLGALGVFLVAAFTTRYVSVASIAAAMAAPFLMAAFGAPTCWVIGGVVVGIAVIARHRSNILRLMHREEPPIGRR